VPLNIYNSKSPAGELLLFTVLNDLSRTNITWENDSAVSARVCFDVMSTQLNVSYDGEARKCKTLTIEMKRQSVPALYIPKLHIIPLK